MKPALGQSNDSRQISLGIPQRISLENCVNLIEQFLVETAGGVRLQTVTAALFTALVRRGLYAAIRRSPSAANNLPPGISAKIDCLDKRGAVCLAVHAQHQALTTLQIRRRIGDMRENHVTEALLITCRGIHEGDRLEIEAMIDREFVRGQNIYLADFFAFLTVTLGVLGESGRRAFLEGVCRELSMCRNSKHATDWAKLLRTC